jgi:hypothetical protein
MPPNIVMDVTGFGYERSGSLIEHSWICIDARAIHRAGVHF